VAQRDSSLTWSIRHDALKSVEAEQVLSEIATACRDSCRAHLPRASGYELTCARLSGPLDGVTITVARANFRAMVSVQRFEAAVDVAERPLRLRLVATAHHVGAEASSDARERTRALWGVSGCVAAMFGTGAIALYLMGLLVTWGVALLVLPAIVGTRMCLAMWIDGNLRQLPPARAEQAQHTARAAAETRDLSRWHRVLREFELQRDLVEERFALRPFRGLSPARPNEASDASLAIASSV
jgi:hypothetical protein